MKKFLVILALVSLAGYVQAQAVAETVTNRGEVITVYTAEGGGSATAAANDGQAVPADFTVGDDLVVTDNATVSGALAVTETLGVTGVATFTAESVHNLGIDADYVTVDAAAGIDTKTAGTLMVGAATADRVEIGDTSIPVEVEGPLTATEDILSNEIDAETATALLVGKATATSVTVGASDINVSVPGTFSVTGVATLTAAPKLTATNTAASVTLTMTNAPTAADEDKTAPIYLNITVGSDSYVIPAWKL